MATRPPDFPSPVERDSRLTRITLDLLPDGSVRITSVCLGQRDAVYAPVSDARAPHEVEQLVAELRQKVAGVNP